MQRSESNPKNEYVLGTGGDELARLGIQHRVWSDAAVAVWKRAGIGVGSRVLDLGCGPGYTSADLAQLVTTRGAIVGVDESAAFLDFVSTQASALQLPQLTTKMGDVQNLGEALKGEEKFDAVYCRWVLCWLKEPQKALEGVRRVLKPGGRLVLHEYFNWKSMTSGPRSPAVEKMVLAAIASFESRHGNMDIGAALPAMLQAAGFKITHFDIHQRVARGGGLDGTLAWPLTWWRTYAPKLVEMGRLSATDAQAALADLDDIECNPERVFFCPPLFEFIATI